MCFGTLSFADYLLTDFIYTFCNNHVVKLTSICQTVTFVLFIFIYLHTYVLKAIVGKT